MLKKLLPVMISVIAFLGGAAGGEMLKCGAPVETATEAPDEATAGHEDTAVPGDGTQGALQATAPEAHPAPGNEGSPALHGAARDASAGHGASGGHGGKPEATGMAWFTFPQQFFVPILHDGWLDSTMILTLSAEMPAEARETVHAHEIKLRDALLRQLLIHANTGGFDGNFTSEAQLRKLRETLSATAQAVVPEISGILIGNIARQER